MKPIFHPECDARLPSPTTRSIILYEDRPAGLRAKEFSDRLTHAEAGTRRAPDSIWRLKMLDFPSLADEATRDAADCDFIIFSLRGDGAISQSTRSWLREVMPEAGERGAMLITLFDPDGTDRRSVEGARHCLRSLCDSHHLPFFSCVTTPPRIASTVRASARAEFVSTQLPPRPSPPRIVIAKHASPL